MENNKMPQTLIRISAQIIENKFKLILEFKT